MTSSHSDSTCFNSLPQFTEAAAFQGLPDPPFVRDNWATATINVKHSSPYPASFLKLTVSPDFL